MLLRCENRMTDDLTGDVHRVVEGFGDFGVHLDEELLLLGKLIVPIGYFSVHPFGKWLAYHSVGDVDQPLAWDLVHVAVFWEVVGDKRILLCPLKNANNVEILILWAIQLFDIVAFDARATA